MLERTVLDSGLVVISEYIPAFPSFAMSYTLRGGSRMETPENNGIYHLLEHMLFKGTEKYDMKEIADLSDRLGGKLNAFTSKEITQFYIKAVDENLKESFDLLTQMVCHSIFPEDEFLKEKNVAIQEIHESEDNPDTNAFEIFYEKIYPQNGLGYPVGGQEEPVASFQRQQVYEFYKKTYVPENMVLSAVGKVKHDQLVQLAQDAYKHYPAKKTSDFHFETPNFNYLTHSKKNRSLNQVYLIMGWDAISMLSPHRYSFMILNDILGSGMSSRLFQKIREERGLAYTVSSFIDAYLDCGLHMIYSVVNPQKVDECVDAVKEELQKLRKTGITNRELKRARDSIKSSIILGLENYVSMMRFHINNELFQEKPITPMDIITKIKHTPAEEIDRLFNTYLDPDKLSLFKYGDIAGNKE